MTELVGVLLLISFSVGGMVSLYLLTSSLSGPELIGYGTGLGWTVASLILAVGAALSGALLRTIGEVMGIVVLVAATVLLVVANRYAPGGVTIEARRPTGAMSSRRVAHPVAFVLPLVGGIVLLGWWGATLVPAIRSAIESGAAAGWVGFPGLDWQGTIPDGIGLTYPADQVVGVDRPGQPVDILAALLMLYGFTPADSVLIVTGGLIVALIVALFGFTVRLTGNPRVATITALLFILQGGVGWVLTAERMNESDYPWSTLADAPWDRSEQLASNYTVENSVLAILTPHPQLILVMLLVLLSSSILVQRHDHSLRWPAGLAGLIGGGAVAAEPTSVVLIAAVGVCALLVSQTGSLTGPIRSWYDWRDWGVWVVTFAGTTIAVLWAMGRPADWRWAPDILTGRDSLLWYWLKNGGWLIPLVIIGLTRWRTLRPSDRRVMAIGIPALLIAHVMTSGGDDYASAALPLALLVAALLAGLALDTLWRQAQGTFGHLLVVIVALMTIGSGLLVNAQLLLER